MKFKTGQSIFYLAIAFLLVFTYLSLFRDTGVSFDAGAEQARMVTLYVPSSGGTPGEELLYHPAAPAPGDFLIVEAGPLPEDSNAELLFDFPGEVSEQYRPGNLFYAIVAVSYETEPGIYSLELITDPGEGAGSDLQAEIIIADKDFRVSYFSMPPGTTAGWTADRLAEDREKVRRARETTEPYPLWLQRFITPLEGRISSGYGAIRIIDGNPPRRHSGIDIVADEGEPIIAPNRGIVRLSEFLLSGGYTVIIDHGMGLSSTYMHLHEIAVAEGQVIERGEEIGTVGMTGYATGPHLHWEINIGQLPVNPGQLVDNDLLWIPPAYTVEKIKQR